LIRLPETFLLDAFNAGYPVQACTVPMYNNVVVEDGGRIVAEAWDGSKGGMIGFGAVNLELHGEITASGMGFRGGQVRPDLGDSNVVDLDTTGGGEGGGKGEGHHFGSWEMSGRGNYANGGGGGNAHNAGGGGGGLGGKGGHGGKQWPGGAGSDDPNTRGMPGTVALAVGRLMMGGGGGAGQQNDSVAGAGGAGGGVVWVSAQFLSGAGTIAADGQHGFDAADAGGGSGRRDGGGGGGSGGMLRIELADHDFQGVISTVGGDGGDCSTDGDLALGPGGGGGGGLVVTNGWTLDVTMAGGSPGTYTGATVNTPWGAEAGEEGVLNTTLPTNPGPPGS
jgi:hypothetical protein